MHHGKQCCYWRFSRTSYDFTKAKAQTTMTLDGETYTFAGTPSTKMG